MPTRLSIPPIPEFREHIQGVLSLLHGYLLAMHGGLVAGDTPLAQAIDATISLPDILALRKKFEAALPHESLSMTSVEGVLLYACYVLSSRLLVSADGEDYGELMYRLWREDGEDQDLRDFATLRDLLLPVNDHLITNADERISEVPGYVQMKARLQAIDV